MTAAAWNYTAAGGRSPAMQPMKSERQDYPDRQQALQLSQVCLPVPARMQQLCPTTWAHLSTLCVEDSQEAVQQGACARCADHVHVCHLLHLQHTRRWESTCSACCGAGIDSQLWLLLVKQGGLCPHNKAGHV